MKQGYFWKHEEHKDTLRLIGENLSLMPLNALNVKERAETHFQYKVYTMEKSLNWPYESGGPHDEIGIFLES